MKLKNYRDPAVQQEFESKGYELPLYDREAVKKATYEHPVWIHFGAGNIFRAFQAELLEQLLNKGLYDRGVIVAEAYDYDIIDRSYRPYDQLTLSVVLHADGKVEKKVIGSVTESLKADPSFTEDWDRLKTVFRDPGLQMVTFSVTENGYVHPEKDIALGFSTRTTMGKITALLYERFLSGAFPLTLQSQDNCSNNGDHVKDAVYAYAEGWAGQGTVSTEFVDYIEHSGKITCPLSMIDKITPRPDPHVVEMLEKDGFEDREVEETEKHSYTAPFVNSEPVGYLVMEEQYPNGHPPFEKAGVIFTDRKTVEKVERMKVGTCLNPLHNALAIYGCMMGFTLVSDIMKDPDLLSFLEHIGNDEGLPVCESPGIIDPKAFMDECLYVRFANPYLPDTPQRIAVDTSTTTGIRFGGTLKEYLKRGKDLNDLTYIPLLFAGYARYLKGIGDDGKPYECSPDDRLPELKPIVEGIEVREGDQDFSSLKKLFCQESVFGVDIYAAGFGDKVEGMAKELFAGPGAVRRTLHKYVTMKK